MVKAPASGQRSMRTDSFMQRAVWTRLRPPQVRSEKKPGSILGGDPLLLVFTGVNLRHRLDVAGVEPRNNFKPAVGGCGRKSRHRLRGAALRRPASLRTRRYNSPHS